jgi:hypothetical protein
MKTNTMKYLALYGSVNRGHEVINRLEMMGGINTSEFKGNNEGCIYAFSEDDKRIVKFGPSADGHPFTIYTLEAFDKKYPLRVTEDVIFNLEICEIKSVEWNFHRNEPIYTVHMFGLGEFEATNDELFELDAEDEPCNCEDNTSGIYIDYGATEEDYPYIDLDNTNYNKIMISDSFEAVVEDGVTYLVKKRLNYPKTYRECFYTLYGHKNDAFNLSGVTDEEYDLIGNLIKLMRCRDAYWKIAGERMGLKKPWEPDLENELLHCIQNYNNQITVSRTNTAFNKILIFPTEEMRDAFYKNFKDLIESCKDLL